MTAHRGRTRDLLSLAGRHVLITGSASGIGRATADLLARCGAELVLVDRDREALEKVAADLSSGGRARVSHHVVDLTRRDQIGALWAAQGSAPPDTLVNNAGSYPLQDFLTLGPAEVASTLELNLLAALWMSQEMIRRRGREGGVIVNISSVEALVPLRDDLVPYGAAKAAVLALTRSLAHAYGRWGFRVNALVPGAIRTPGTQSLRRQAIRHADFGLIRTGLRFDSRLSMGHWGSADDVARAVLFLVSDLASYVHGASIPVDGGFLAS